MITAFRLLPGLWQLAIVGAVLAAIIGAYSFWHYTVYQRGYDAAIAAIAVDNKEAVDAANAARQKVRDCNSSGGAWDSIGGVCTR